MYAVIKTGGKQYKVKQGDELLVELLDGAAGESVSFQDVLMVRQGKETLVGTPTVDGAVVKATVVADERGPKIYIFRKKRRKTQQKKIGHRQDFTRVRIDSIETA